MALAGCTGVFIGFETPVRRQSRAVRASGLRGPRTTPAGCGIFHEHGIQVNGSFVFGFDGDRKDVFAATVEWIEANRLECATFHILTPYPGTPLFRQLEPRAGCCTATGAGMTPPTWCSGPKHMTPEELMLGYDWVYRRLFSHASIWRRRPDGVAVRC